MRRKGELFMVPSQLTLVVPGLLGPLSDAIGDIQADPHVPGLLRLLHSARAVPGTTDLDAWLCARFGIARDPEADWPQAPLLAQFELGDAGEDYWLRADPVHLRADRARLVLFGPEALAIQQEEADALAEAFNALYQPDGLRLYAPTPNRWYLRLARPPGLSTTPLPEVIGRGIDGFLPRGPDAAEWHARLNEIQMLFHAHAVNEQRVVQGRPAVNSLWLWGGGRLPAAYQARDTWICSDDPLTRALAGAAGVPRLQPGGAVQEWLPAALEQGPGLVVLDVCRQAQQYGDVQGWRERLQDLESRWWEPLHELRARGRLRDMVLLAPPGGGYQIGVLRWWERLRRPRPLQQYLAS